MLTRCKNDTVVDIFMDTQIRIIAV